MPGREDVRCKVIQTEIARHVVETGKNMKEQRTVNPGSVHKEVAEFMLEAGEVLMKLSGTTRTVGEVANHFSEIESIEDLEGEIMSLNFDGLFNLCFGMVYGRASIADALNSSERVRR